MLKHSLLLAGSGALASEASPQFGTRPPTPKPCSCTLSQVPRTAAGLGSVLRTGKVVGTWHKLLGPRTGKKNAEEHGHFCSAEGSAQPLTTPEAKGPRTYGKVPRAQADDEPE